MKLLIICLCGAALVALAVFIWARPQAYRETDEMGHKGRPIQGAVLELTALVKSQAEAERIAADYGITLKSVKSGVALFETEKTMQELEALRQEKKLPELSVNHIYQTSDQTNSG